MIEDVPETIQSLSSKVMKDMLAQQETYLLQFFGSLENARRSGDGYILELEPMEMFTDVDPLYVDVTSFRMSQKMQLRPKTEEEKLHDRADAILAEHTRTYPVCIVCKDPVTEKQNLVNTVHGPYHGLPMTCTNGHDDLWSDN